MERVSNLTLVNNAALLDSLSYCANIGPLNPLRYHQGRHLLLVTNYWLDFSLTSVETIDQYFVSWGALSIEDNLAFYLLKQCQ